VPAVPEDGRQAGERGDAAPVPVLGQLRLEHDCADCGAGPQPVDDRAVAFEREPSAVVLVARGREEREAVERGGPLAGEARRGATRGADRDVGDREQRERGESGAPDARGRSGEQGRGGRTARDRERDPGLQVELEERVLAADVLADDQRFGDDLDRERDRDDRRDPAPRVGRAGVDGLPQPERDEREHGRSPAPRHRATRRARGRRRRR
jgi:hypothetical protein